MNCSIFIALTTTFQHYFSINSGSAIKEKSLTSRQRNKAFDEEQSKKIIKLYNKVKSMPKVRKALNKKWKTNVSIDAYYKAKKRLESGN